MLLDDSLPTYLLDAENYICLDLRGLYWFLKDGLTIPSAFLGDNVYSLRDFSQSPI